MTVDEDIPADATLLGLLHQQLEVFDSIFAETSKPVASRPFEAACMFAEYCVVEVHNGTKDGLLDQPWFKYIFVEVRKWYRHRYGAAADLHPSDEVRGLLLVHGTPFGLTVPMTIVRDHEDPNLVWSIWPMELLPEESSLDFLDQRLGPATMTDPSVESGITEIVNRLRGIRNNIRMIPIRTTEEGALAGSLMNHLSKAAADLMLPRWEESCVGLWELQMAVEKVFKLAIRLGGATPPHTHDLDHLAELASQTAGWFRIDRSLLDRLPNAHAAVRYRYGEGVRLDPSRTWEIYTSTLTLVHQATSNVPSKIRMTNMSMLIRRLDLFKEDVDK